MQSLDNEILFDIIEPPYYRCTFTDVPMDPFAIVLFGYLGKINQGLYEKYLRIFKDIIPTSNNLQTLGGGEIWRTLHKSEGSKGSLDTLLDMIQEENSTNYILYYFLYDFFKLECKVYEEPKDIKYHNRYTGESSNIDVEREVYLFLNKGKLYPICRQEIDGSIRCMSNPL